jgi:cupin superfamily acireductone dioxygenase involved in methionine salvage
MKIFSQKPVLTLTLEEKDTLIKAKKILNELTDYVETEVNELLEESGYGYDDVINALQVVGELLEVAVTPNSIEAKSIVFSLTTELIF